MNIPYEEFFHEKFLRSVLFVVLQWFIMAIIHILNKVLEKSTLVDINAQIVVVHMKKIMINHFKKPQNWIVIATIYYLQTFL
ncbi:MAG: putative transposase [Euryarchaeota archaeon]|nr:putative transposase [Euryarchaeota archaeon]